MPRISIIEALQKEGSLVRVSDCYRWLCADGEGGWIVKEHLPGSRETIIVKTTKSEFVAVEYLLGTPKEVCEEGRKSLLKEAVSHNEEHQHKRTCLACGNLRK